MSASAAWVTTREAGAALGMSATSVARLVATGRLSGQRHGRALLLHAADVEALADERARWVSLVTAARITGFGARTIQRAAADGDIDQRPGPTALPSISRASLEVWAIERRTQLEAAAAARAERDRRARAPDDGHDWVGPEVVAVRLEISRSRVRQLARDDRLPMVQAGRWWWMRVDHLEQVAAAREARP